jgi:hypothetical protein
MQGADSDQTIADRSTASEVGDQDAATPEGAPDCWPAPEPHVQKWPQRIRAGVLIGLAIACWIILLEVL